MDEKPLLHKLHCNCQEEYCGENLMGEAKEKKIKNKFGGGGTTTTKNKSGKEAYQ